MAIGGPWLALAGRRSASPDTAPAGAEFELQLVPRRTQFEVGAPIVFELKIASREPWRDHGFTALQLERRGDDGTWQPLAVSAADEPCVTILHPATEAQGQHGVAAAARKL